MDKNSIVVDGKTYVPKDSIKEQEFEGDVKIVILQRGWVMVGKLEQDENKCKLHNASVIRIWGTTQGIGEIAKGGPTSSTRLDKCYGVVEFDALTVIATIACSEEKWADKL